MALRTLPSLVLIAVLTLGGCMASEVDPKPGADYDKGTDFSAYHTFAWKTPDPFVNSSEVPVEQPTQQELMDEAARQLESKGLKEVRSNDPAADLFVSIQVGSQSGAIVDNFQSWGSGWGEETLDLRSITTAGLSIELINRKSGEHVWTGWATTPLTQEVYVDRAEVVKQMVDAVLKKYPPDS